MDELPRLRQGDRARVAAGGRGRVPRRCLDALCLPWRRALYPIAVASQAIPIAVLALPLLIWLGFGLLPKLVLIGIVSFFSVVVTTLAGLDRVDPALLKLMRTFDANRWRTFRHVELPAALPGVFTGLKLTLVFAVIGDVLAEQSGSNSGLGYIILTADSNLRSLRCSPPP